MGAEDGSIRISKEMRWVFGLASATLLLFGGFVGRAFELGATYVTKDEVAQEVAEKVDQLRREMSAANDLAAARTDTLRAEMKGGFETLRAQIDALRAEQRVPDGR